MRRPKKPLVQLFDNGEIRTGKLDTIVRSLISSEFDIAWIDHGTYFRIALLSEIKYL